MFSRVLAFVALMLLLPACQAQMAIERFQAGTHYFPINSLPNTSTSKMVEVQEIFSYGCIHCYNFQTFVDQWKAKKPANATFSYVHVTGSFNAAYEPLSRGFQAAQALGILETTHVKMFEAIFKEHRQFRTFEDVADFYAEHGAKREDVISAGNSFAANTRIKQTDELMRRAMIDGTPTVLVGGKYRVTGSSAGSLENYFEVVNFLVDKVAAERASAAK